MSTIGIAGAGAFGTALAIALARGGRRVTLLARDADSACRIQTTRLNAHRLPGVTLPDNISVSSEIGDLSRSDAILLSIPMQALGGFLKDRAGILNGLPLVACCKGISLETGTGPSAIIAAVCPGSPSAILTGPSFAADIARGLPTALTLATTDGAAGARLQKLLATPVLRLYRSSDPIGAELGGALKNVIAIAAGIVIGAQFGDSARAALMTRGFAEMQRIATALGAVPETLSGLSGLGDLVLTCTSDQSRNFRYGRALGQGVPFEGDVTVEGVATARAVAQLAARQGIETPVAAMVAAVVEGRLSVAGAAEALMTRPLREE